MISLFYKKHAKKTYSNLFINLFYLINNYNKYEINSK